jgi:hypothetical protein
MTTSERVQASEADLATVSVAEGMDALTATATVKTQDAESSASATPEQSRPAADETRRTRR